MIQNALDACKIRMWKDISEGRYKKWIKRESEFGLQPYEIDRKVLIIMKWKCYCANMIIIVLKL